MAVELMVRPISEWPVLARRRQRAKRSQFKASWSSTDRLLRHEIGHLGGTLAVLELQVSERDIRNDGWIRADARPRGDGVILSFKSRHGPLRYPCETYDY